MMGKQDNQIQKVILVIDSIYTKQGLYTSARDERVHIGQKYY